MSEAPETPTPARTPRVWVVYRDTRKDMAKAEAYGQLTEMFTGRVNYGRAVEQARKMLEGYADGDHIMMIGDPALCAIVVAVALEYSAEETVRLLRWDREEVEYRPLELEFAEPDEAEALDVRDLSEAAVTHQNRYR